MSNLSGWSISKGYERRRLCLFVIGSPKCFIASDCKSIVSFSSFVVNLISCYILIYFTLLSNSSVHLINFEKLIKF